MPESRREGKRVGSPDCVGSTCTAIHPWTLFVLFMLSPSGEQTVCGPGRQSWPDIRTGPWHTFCKGPRLREIKPPRIERIERIERIPKENERPILILYLPAVCVSTCVFMSVFASMPNAHQDQCQTLNSHGQGHSHGIFIPATSNEEAWPTNPKRVEMGSSFSLEYVAKINSPWKWPCLMIPTLLCPACRRGLEGGTGMRPNTVTVTVTNNSQCMPCT